jgi:nitroimidazol reductase NimA-like FMN-containing flavoprotein (pyridoxamine 5'-phosphate oxidase superfamily)
VDFPHLERLSRAECRQLLSSAPLGRLAVPTSHFPTLEPVSFAVVEGELIVAVRAGTAGEVVAAGTVVTFEADVLDHAARQGWSVVVSGPVEELDAEVATLVRPLLAPWPVTGTDRLLLIRSERITGQRVVAGPSEPDAAPVEPVAVAVSLDAPTPGSAIVRRMLSPEEALTRLRQGGQMVGRLVVGLPDGPAVFPLNFAVDGDAIVFRTQVGTKLTAITRSLATFEVDDFDSAGSGWAVTFEGLAQEVLDSDPVALQSRMAVTTIDTWPGGDRSHVVRITAYRVHGSAWTVAQPVVAAAPKSAETA